MGIVGRVPPGLGALRKQQTLHIRIVHIAQSIKDLKKMNFDTIKIRYNEMTVSEGV